MQPIYKIKINLFQKLNYKSTYISCVHIFILVLKLNSYLTIITDANTHLGKASKKGPIHSKIISNIVHDTILAICVFPPTVCWIKDLLSDAENGIHEKNDPTTLLIPYLNKNMKNIYINVTKNVTNYSS